jgi:hypothetical protein
VVVVAAGAGVSGLADASGLGSLGDGRWTRARAPAKVVSRFRKQHPELRIEVVDLPRAAGCYGNVGRHAGLQLATGDAVCWFNHDNLITPDYLATHAALQQAQPGAISIVGIDYWRDGVCHGVFPRRIAAGHLDLLCYSLPVTLARQIDAFGPAMQTIYAADWHTFQAARNHAPVIQSSTIAGVHF